MTLPEELNEGAFLMETVTETAMESNEVEADLDLPECTPVAIPIPLLSPAEIGEAFSEFHPRLLAVARRICRGEADAMDAVQNGFEKALKNRHQFRGDSKISTWLHRIVANESLMSLRSQKRHPTESDEILETSWAPRDARPNAEEELEAEQRALLLRGAIAELGEEDVAILERCCLGDESYASFGAAMNLHPAAVKTRAFRARRRLREVVERAFATGILPGEPQRLIA